MKKTLAVFLLLSLLAVGTYVLRDPLLKVFLGPYLTISTGFSIKVK